MIKIIDYYVYDKAAKQQYKSEIIAYVKALVRNAELENILCSKRYKKSSEELQSCYVEIDILTCDDIVIQQALGFEAERFIKDRKNILSLYEEINKLPPISDLKTLSITDQIHIVLLAHKLYKKINLAEVKDIFYKNNENKEFISDNFIKKCSDFKKNRGSAKDVIRSFMYRLVGKDGRYFYGIKYKRCGISNLDLWEFAYLLQNEKKDDLHMKSVTELCTLLLYGGNSEYEIVYTANKADCEQKKIYVEDFIIKGNVFKCKDKLHNIKDIIAEFDIINNDGEIVACKVPAGYCENCNVYFILESIYFELRQRGIILCKIVDEKSYYKKLTTGERNMASQSILMEYGYHVSQRKELSAENRRLILSVLLDNNIISKSEIISYLNLFISQKKSMYNMQTAVSRWKEDKLFVEKYQDDDKCKMYRVESLRRE